MDLVKTKRKGGYFTSYIRRRIERNKNFICAITGPTGSGKSWGALRLGEILDPDFGIDNVVFSPVQFMDLLNGKVKDLKRGSVVVFDEFQVSMSHLDYQSLIAKLLNFVLQTFRHKNLILIITTPSFSFVNASARKLFHCRMETVGINSTRGIVRFKPFLFQINQKKNMIYEKWLKIWTEETGIVPFKRLGLSKPTSELVNAYEKKKTEFTADLNKSIAKDLQKMNTSEVKPLTEVQEGVATDLSAGKLPAEIASRMGVALQAIYTHMVAIKKKGLSLTHVLSLSHAHTHTHTHTHTHGGRET